MSNTSKVTELFENFISPVQIEALTLLFHGEERDSAREIVNRLSETVSKMPQPYGTDHIATNNKIVYLHYFKGNSDWYIVERDSSPEQHQAYGYAILNGDRENAEFGYIPIIELISYNVELDFHFIPCTFEQLKSQWK